MILKKLATILLLLLPGLVLAEARQIDEFQWEGVQRIVAVGDIHGDYDHYMATLRAAGLVDSKGKWAGGKTHFVQVGDLPDRGPDTKEIIDHITQLTKQAKRKGGRVHSLIGNHEMMNVTGDLRYVHPGEYEAFVTRKSKAMRDRYYTMYMERFEQQDPTGFAALPADFQVQWEKEHPLGWLEHRQAWDPAWNRDAEYAKWVMDKKVAIRVNDNLFVHGGISGFYCANSLDSMTEKAVAVMQSFDLDNPGIAMDPNGPLWYRGLSGMEPQASEETVDAILDRQGVSRIVVGHQPTSGVIWPNYDGKVVMIDTGISNHYGGHVAYLEILPDAINAGYPWGKLELPASDAEAIPYLEKVIEHDPQSGHMKARLKKLLSPVETTPADGPVKPSLEGVEVLTAPICGTS